MATLDQAAQAAYEAYCEAVGGVAFNGDTLPTWEQQRQRSPKIADAWRAAVLAVAGALTAARLTAGEGAVELASVAKGGPDVPGWEGSQGPFKSQYHLPHVYARDVHSGAGNCVCGWEPGHQLHVQVAPGVDVPDRLRT